MTLRKEHSTYRHPKECYRRKKKARKRFGSLFIRLIIIIAVSFSIWHFYSNNRTYEGIVFEDGIIPVQYYNQKDVRYANELYGNDLIKTHACGPVSMGIVIESLTGQESDPVSMSNWAFEHGYYAQGSGSYHALIPAIAEAHGLSVEGDLDGQGIIDALSSGKLVVVIMGEGHFTTGGHFIVLRGITEDGKILIADTASYSRSKKEWDLQIILDESSKAYVAGGPYWAVGLPEQ